MPATPLYLHRLAGAISMFESLPQEWIDRRLVEEALGVGKWTAWRIMRSAGATEGPGNTIICGRDTLVARLRELQQDRRFGPEIARHERLERYLGEIAQFASRKHKEIARGEAAETLAGTRFQALPAGVELHPGELRIAFSGSADFLRKFGAVVYALQNDLEKMQDFLDGAGDSEAGGRPR